MARTVGIVLTAMRLSWLRDSEYAMDFVTSFVHFAVQLGGNIIYWVALMTGFKSLGDWGLPELILLSAMGNLAPILDLFYLGFRDLPQKVLNGELDKFLSKPCNPLVALLSEHLYVRYPVYQAITALVTIAWVVLHFGLTLSVMAVGRALVLLVMGLYVMRFFNGIITLSVFWLGKIDNVRLLTRAIGSLSRYPVTIYKTGIRRLLTYFLPYGLAATYPTLALTGWRPPVWFWLAMVGLLVGWGAAFSLTWQAALRRYESYGG